MKARKILLDPEEEEALDIGLIRLIKKLPDHEFFFDFNRSNDFHFSRIADLRYTGTYYDYSYSRFETFYSEARICLRCISNRPFASLQKKISQELFGSEDENKLLLPQYPDVDYILTASEPFADFSVILPPEKLLFHIQKFCLSSDEELFQIIHYYE